MKRRLTIRNENVVVFEGEVEDLEMSVYENSIEMEFNMNRIGYKLDIPKGYVIVLC